VFAAGIVLYQLTVGKLPFEGKNPHEVLKRIAECKFVDPRQANPRIGNRLGRIILRAMAAEPAARYPAIGEMVLALEAYLEESGIAPDKVPGELARYFQSPAPYEQALKERLLDHLTRRGGKLLDDGDQAPALDVFDRVLTIDPANAKVLAILDGINRRARLKTAGLAVLAIGVLSGGGYMIHRNNQPPPAQAPSTPLTTIDQHLDVPSQNVQHEVVPDAPPRVEAIDAAPQVVVTTPHDAASALPLDAGAPDAVPTQVTVSPAKGVQYWTDADPRRQPVPEDGKIALFLTHETRVYVHDTSLCCQDDDKLVKPGAADQKFEINALPGQVIPICDHPNVYVNMDGKPVELGKANAVPFDKALSRTRKVTIEFVGENIDKTPIPVTVDANKDARVECVAR